MFALLVTWYLLPVLMLLFGGLLMAVFLRVPTDWLAAHTPLSDRTAYLLVLVVLVLTFVTGSWLVAPSLSTQMAQLAEVLPEGIEQIEDRIQSFSWYGQVAESVELDRQSVVEPRNLLERIFGAFVGAFGVVADAVIVLFVGLYLAAQPQTYTRGVIRLFPMAQQPRLRRALAAVDIALRRWLAGRAFEMVVVGTLLGLGLWLLQVPLALLLGLIAGLLAFIPFIGTYLAVIPAALVALAQDPTTLLYVLLLYLGVQAIEGYFLTPLVQERIVAAPPVLGFASQLILGVLAGSLGVALAFPAAVVAMVLVKTLYMEDVLGEPVELPDQ